MRLGTWNRVVTVVGLAALLGMACGGEDDGESEPSAECTPVAPAEAVIDQDALKFKPTTLCVSAGQEVLFKNSESAIHTVTIEGKNESGTMKRGGEYRWTPPQAGAFRITCEFHPQMKAIVTALP